MTPTLPDNWPYRNPTSERDRNEEKFLPTRCQLPRLLELLGLPNFALKNSTKKVACLHHLLLALS